MFRGILTGKIRLDYARHRHPLWIAELEPSRPVEPAAAAAPLPAEPLEDEPEAEVLPDTKETMESAPPPVSQPESGDSGRNP